MTELTILTSPPRQSRLNIGAYKRYIKKLLGYPPRGPSSVLRSLVSGLQSEGINFNHNPRLQDMGENVIVLSNIEALKNAIELKKAGKIKKLLAGPNLMVWSNEFDGILASDQVDICIVPCAYVRAAYEKDNPAITGKVRVWYAGVDERFWQPNGLEKSKDVLIYWKTESDEFIRSIENKLKEFGWNPFRVTYGQYGQDGFKKDLQKARFAVFVSKSESQGIALAESWAMDVPSLVWSPKTGELNGTVYSPALSAPYLNSSVGEVWRTLSDFEDLLKRINNGPFFLFKPREWVLKNMTDKASARLLLEIIYSGRGGFYKCQNHLLSNP